MKLVLSAQVEKTYEWLGQIEDDQMVESLIAEFSEQQPVLFTYLMAMGEGDFDAPEQELFLFLGLVIWKSLRDAGNEIPGITETHLESVQEHNMTMLEYLAEESEEGFVQVAQTLMEDSPQPALLRFLVEIVFEDEAEVIRTSNQGIFFIFLKILVDSVCVALAD
jgi:hypothetical protein